MYFPGNTIEDMKRLYQVKPIFKNQIFVDY